MAFDTFLIICRKVHESKIILLNGTILEGMATFPEGPASIPIRFKTDNNSSTQSTNSDRDVGRYDNIQTSWLCIRKEEPSATKMTSTYWKNKKNLFVLAATACFKDNELVKKIQAGEFSWKGVDKIVNEYNGWKKNN